MMAHVQIPDLVFQQNRQVHLNRRGCQFSRLLAVEECGSVDSNCTDHILIYSARLLATHSIHIFPLHFPSCASPCAIRFRTRYTAQNWESTIDHHIIINLSLLKISTHILLLITVVSSGGSMYVHMHTEQKPQTHTRAPVYCM